MTDSRQPAGPADVYPPPPSGPPPGHNGLDMHPTGHPAADSYSDLYDNAASFSTDSQHQYHQTAHQPPPLDSDGAPKKANWTQRLNVLGSKAAVPFNMLANKLGSESFLPSTMDKESDKAARILRNFCSTSRVSGRLVTAHLNTC